MAGRGPAPKPGDRKAGHSKSPIPEKTVTNWKTERRDLPTDLLPGGEDWHPATVRVWNGMSSFSETWTETEWCELEAYVVLHNEFMRKRTFTLASELRLRGAKFGVTPEDKARLRIVLVDADEKDAKRPTAPVSARDRIGSLHALPAPKRPATGA